MDRLLGLLQLLGQGEQLNQGDPPGGIQWNCCNSLAKLVLGISQELLVDQPQGEPSAHLEIIVGVGRFRFPRQLQCSLQVTVAKRLERTLQ